MSEYERATSFYLVNYKHKLTQEDTETKLWLNQGYIIVDKRTYLECVDKFTIAHQKRIKKTLAQRLRRAQTGRSK